VDIRKEWESCLRTPEVQALFQSLKEGDSSFWAFDSLEQFVGFMNKPSPDAYAIKDGCLWRIIQHIQTTSNGVAGLSLLTYLMANALQAILRDVNRPQTNTKANFQDVWWQFLQAVVAYPLTRRPHKVAANLAMDTRRRLWNDWRSEDQRASMLVPLDGQKYLWSQDSTIHST